MYSFSKRASKIVSWLLCSFSPFRALQLFGCVRTWQVLFPHVKILLHHISPHVLAIILLCPAFALATTLFALCAAHLLNCFHFDRSHTNPPATSPWNSTPCWFLLRLHLLAVLIHPWPHPLLHMFLLPWCFSLYCIGLPLQVGMLQHPLVIRLLKLARCFSPSSIFILLVICFVAGFASPLHSAIHDILCFRTGHQTPHNCTSCFLDQTIDLQPRWLSLVPHRTFQIDSF